MRMQIQYQNKLIRNKYKCSIYYYVSQPMKKHLREKYNKCIIKFQNLQEMDSWEMVACSSIIAIYDSQSKLQPTVQYNPHRGIVNCATYNHMNKLIASCGKDSKIVLAKASDPKKIILDFNYSTGREQTSSVAYCAFSSRSTYIAAGSTNSTVKIWSTKSPLEPILKIKAHGGAVTSLAWFSNEEILSSSSTKGDIFIHSLKTGSIIENFTSGKQPINHICLAEDKKIAACTSFGSLLVWDINSLSSKPYFHVSDHKRSSISSISISPGKPALMVSASVNSNMIFFDINSKRQIRQVTTEQSLTAIAFHQNGHTIAAGGTSGRVMIYDLRNPTVPTSTFSGHETPIKHVEFAFMREKNQERHGESFRQSKTKQINQEPLKKESKTKVVTPNSSNQNFSQRLKDEERYQKNPRLRNLAKREEYKPYNLESNEKSQATQMKAPSFTGNNTYISNQQQKKPEKQVRLENLEEQVKNIRMQMYEHFQTLQLEIIRQSQIQLKEIKKIMDSRDQQKKQLKSTIQKLERQNKEIKKRTY